MSTEKASLTIPTDTDLTFSTATQSRWRWLRFLRSPLWLCLLFADFRHGQSNVPGSVPLIFGEVLRKVDLPQPCIEGGHILQGIGPHLLNPFTLAHMRVPTSMLIRDT